MDQANKFKDNMIKASNAAHNLLNVSLENMQELISLQLEISKQALEKTSSAAKHMLHTATPQELLTNASRLVSDTVEKNVEHCRSIYDMMNKAKSRFSKALESQLNTHKESTFAMPAWMEKFQSQKFDTKSAINSFINSANLAVDSAAKLANEATAITSNNMLYASETLENVISTTKKAASATVTTARKATTEAVNTASTLAAETAVAVKKVAAEAVNNIINSAKKASDSVAQTVTKSANASSKSAEHSQASTHKHNASE
ncbi:MAG: hypothetical protein QG673_328 [Pseudomonadota bacterium]|nr:hypothetical protein [Pseudomonadota bacterium]